MLKDRVLRLLKHFTPAFWVWTGLCAALVIYAVILAVKVFLSGSVLTREAIDKGQQVVIHIASGDVDGSVQHTRQVQAAPAPATPPVGTPAGSIPLAQTADKPAVAAAPQTSESLAPAPLSSIAEPSDKGLIPMSSRDGTMPWKYYARPYTPAADKKPIIAILLTNLGLSKPLTEKVLTLPHTYTLSFSPYAADAKNWVATARNMGFETLVDLPMEPSNYPVSDPGPYGLLEELSATESQARLHWVLSRFPGFIGTLAPENEKLTANINALRPTLLELTARGLFFIYVKTPANAPVADLAKLRALNALGVDLVLDDEITPPAIDKQLDALTQLAKTQGYAVAMAHSYPPTLDALARWDDTLAAQGVTLVPVSAIAKKVSP